MKAIKFVKVSGKQAGLLCSLAQKIANVNMLPLSCMRDRLDILPPCYTGGGFSCIAAMIHTK